MLAAHKIWETMASLRAGVQRQTSPSRSDVLKVAMLCSSMTFTGLAWKRPHLTDGGMTPADGKRTAKLNTERAKMDVEYEEACRSAEAKAVTSALNTIREVYHPRFGEVKTKEDALEALKALPVARESSPRCPYEDPETWQKVIQLSGKQVSLQDASHFLYEMSPSYRPKWLSKKPSDAQLELAEDILMRLSGSEKVIVEETDAMKGLSQSPFKRWRRLLKILGPQLSAMYHNLSIWAHEMQWKAKDVDPVSAAHLKDGVRSFDLMKVLVRPDIFDSTGRHLLVKLLHE